MTSNETENYEALYEHIKEEIESASVAIRESKGNLSYLDFLTWLLTFCYFALVVIFQTIKLLISLIKYFFLVSY